MTIINNHSDSKLNSSLSRNSDFFSHPCIIYWLKTRYNRYISCSHEWMRLISYHKHGALLNLEITPCALIPEFVAPVYESILGTRNTCFPPSKSVRAFLFNGSIVMPTPSCVRALFPMVIAPSLTLAESCLTQTHTSHAMQSKLNRIGSGKGGDGRLSERWPGEE